MENDLGAGSAGFIRTGRPAADGPTRGYLPGGWQWYSAPD